MHELLLIFSIKIWYFKGYDKILPNKTGAIVPTFFKPTQMHQNLFQYSFDIEIKKIQVINIVSIKDIMILFIEISSFTLKTPYKQRVKKTTK